MAAFQRLLQLLADIASRLDTTISAVATRWVLERPAVAAVIVGIGNRPRAEQNRGLVNLRLDDEDRQTIAAHLPTLPVPPGDASDLERGIDGPHVRMIKTALADSAGI